MSADKDRIHRIIHLLEMAWLRHPDLRFFQLLVNEKILVIKKTKGENVVLNPFFVEDYILEAMLAEVLE